MFSSNTELRKGVYAAVARIMIEHTHTQNENRDLVDSLRQVSYDTAKAINDAKKDFGVHETASFHKSKCISIEAPDIQTPHLYQLIKEHEMQNPKSVFEFLNDMCNAYTEGQNEISNNVF